MALQTEIRSSALDLDSSSDRGDASYDQLGRWLLLLYYCRLFLLSLLLFSSRSGDCYDQLGRRLSVLMFLLILMSLMLLRLMLRSLPIRASHHFSLCQGSYSNVTANMGNGEN